MKTNIKVGITHGDPNGVGYEVILKALEDNRILELCTPVVYGSAKAASYYRKALELPPMQMQQIRSASEAREGQYNIVNVIGEDLKIEPGVASKAAGQAALAALQRAVEDIKAGNIDVLVTAPINKSTIHSDTFNFTGHTEYLENALASDPGQPERALMVLFNDSMRVALATVHVPLSRVADSLTVAGLTERIVTLNNTLRCDFGIVRPRIAVLSLNPHSGDGGLLGHEETDVIIPAIEAAKLKKIQCFGPYAADGFFGAAMFRHFDGILAMYHDQGLAPLKALGMDNGVNFTAGLRYVRTSPDHGTAFDIAGRGEASPESMRQAIYSAIDIYRHRATFAEMTANPLRKQYYEKNKSDNVVLDLSKPDNNE